MTYHRRLALALLLGAAGLALLLSACSLAEDVTPPPGANLPAPVGGVGQAPSGAGTLPTLQGFPQSIPSAVRGALIYAERCAACHGPTGGGDGERASQLPNRPAALADPALAREASPARWFQIVTLGNLDRFMPPFAEGLTDSQRWDVVFYLYTLSAPPGQAEEGRALYDASCASCHGPGGAGDGPQAPAGAPDLTGQALMAAKSESDLFEAIGGSPGHAAAGFGASLSEDERWILASFLRTFTFDLHAAVAAQQPPAGTPVPGAAPASGTGAAPSPTGTGSPGGTVSGAVINHTAGSVIPPDLPVVLHAFDNMQETQVITATVGSDGAFQFADVPLISNRALIVTVVHQGVLYASEIVRVDGEQTAFDLPLGIYDATTDTSAVTIDRLHVFVQFVEGKAQVGELYIISNNGDKTIRADPPGAPLLQFVLPQGATDLAFQDGTLGDRYQQTANGFADTASVQPGSQSHQVLLSFSLPYDGKLDFSQPLNYSAAALNVLLPENGPQLNSAQLQDLGVRQMGETSLRNFVGTAVQSGQALEFSLSGKVASSAPTVVTGVGSRAELLVGIAALGAVLVGLGAWWLRRGTGAEEDDEGEVEEGTEAARQPTSVEELVRAIAALDDDFATGKLDEADYRVQRARLKRQALALMEGAAGSGQRAAGS